MTYTYKDKKTLRGLIEVALTEDYDKIEDYLFTHTNNYRDSEGYVWDADGYIIHTTIAKPGVNYWKNMFDLIYKYATTEEMKRYENDVKHYADELEKIDDKIEEIEEKLKKINDELEETDEDEEIEKYNDLETEIDRLVDKIDDLEYERANIEDESSRLNEETAEALYWEHCGELETNMQDDRLREIGIDNLIDGACRQLFNDEYTLSDFYEILESGDPVLIYAFINSQFYCEGEAKGNSYGFDDLVLYVDFFPSESDNEIDELKKFFQILFTYECGSELEKHGKKYVELLRELEKYSELDEINTLFLDIDEYNEYEHKKAEFECTKGELFQLAKDIYDNYVYEIDRKMLLDAINDKYTIEEWKDEVKTVIAYNNGYYEY